MCRLHRFVLDSHLATLWESNCPFGFLLVMFPLGSSYFVFVFLSLWCLWSEVWDNCIDSWSLPSFLFCGILRVMFFWLGPPWFNYWFSFTLAYSRISHEYSSLFIIVINLIFMFSLWCIDWVGSLYANRILCISVLRVASGPRVKLASCKSALNPPVVCSTDRSKAVVPVLVLLFVAL